MAAVTVTKQRTNIDGSYREKTYTINIAANGDTLAVSGMKAINATTSNDTAVTKMTVTGNSIAFATGGAVTGAMIRVIGL